MLLDGSRLELQDLGHGQKTQVLQVLIRVLNVQPQLGDTQLPANTLHHHYITIITTVLHVYTLFIVWWMTYMYIWTYM